MASEIPNRRIIKNPWSKQFGAIVADLLADNDYLIDGRVSDSWEFNIHQNTNFQIFSMEEGQKIDFSFTAEPTLLPAALPLLVTFSTSAGTIVWLNKEIVEVFKEARVTLKKAEGIIYAEFVIQAELYYVSATGNTTTTSTTDVLLNAMTLTPGKGNYIAYFSSTNSNSNNNRTNTFSIYVNGVLVADSVRDIMDSNNSISTAVNIMTRLLDVEDGQAIEVRWKVSANTGTVYQRTFSLKKI